MIFYLFKNSLQIYKLLFIAPLLKTDLNPPFFRIIIFPMRIQFRIPPDGFKELTRLIKRLELFTSSNCQLYLIIQRPDESHSNGIFRFFIDGQFKVMSIFHCDTTLSELIFKSTQDYAVFQLPIDNFFKLITAIQGHNSDYYFSMKKKDEFKFMQVEILEAEQIYRIFINQVALSRIQLWIAITQFDYRARIQRAEYQQLLDWLGCYTFEAGNEFKVQFGKDEKGASVFIVKVTLEDSEFQIHNQVEVSPGENYIDERDIGSHGFEVLTKIMSWHQPTSLLKKKDAIEFCFDVESGPWILQVSLPTAPVTEEDRSSGVIRATGVKIEEGN